MNPSIKKLVDLAKKKSRKIIGLMSGTSLDGLDIALCEIRGTGDNTDVQLVKFVTAPYSDETRKQLKRISSVEDVKLKEITYWHTKLAHLHSEMILEALHEWKINSVEVDCIASHGQTIYHYPARDQKSAAPVNSTLQIGDGDHIAATTGILTISDFRQKHVAHGGEGAPIAGLVDRILFTHDTETRILLNIGGIGNFTFLPAKKDSDNGSFTTDTGPGNTLIDALMMHYFQKAYDEDGKIAFSGTLHQNLLNELLSDTWFDEKESKTTGPEYFNRSWFEKKIVQAGLDREEISGEDLIRTASELSARTIAESIQNYTNSEESSVIYVSGGGAYNPYLMKQIQDLLQPLKVKNISEIGLSPDAKEAVLFAVLANEMLAGEGFEMEIEKGKKQSVNFGKISFPE